jgi:hypothetical protein
MELENDTWYWVSDPREGDIFYPVYVNETGHVVMDGKHNDPKNIKGLTIDKAVMPDDVHSFS